MLLSSRAPSDPQPAPLTAASPSPSVESNLTEPAFSDHTSASDTYEYRMEKRMKEVLSLIEGVGRVEVDITLEQGTEFVYGVDSTNTKNHTDERDNNGGVRVIEDASDTQKIVLYRNKNGDEQPLIRTEKLPKVMGALVVAEGANDPRVNAEISRAVNTVLGVPLHKICVLPYKR